jgi:hypothetical protein
LVATAADEWCIRLISSRHPLKLGGYLRAGASFNCVIYAVPACSDIGEEFFQHQFPHERSDLSHWRKRLGDKLEQLLAESLRVAHESGALRSQDLKRVTTDTTVQPKNISFPTDAKLLQAAIKASTAWPTSMGCSCGNPTSASPNARR